MTEIPQGIASLPDDWFASPRAVSGTLRTLAHGATSIVASQISVAKSSVSAGKNNSGKIAISGNMDATADDFNDANAVEVTISSADVLSPCIQTLQLVQKGGRP
jgi:hypothetical protein